MVVGMKKMIAVPTNVVLVNFNQKSRKKTISWIYILNKTFHIDVLFIGRTFKIQDISKISFFILI